MTIKLSVPTIDSPESANELREHILTSESDAKVEIDVETKTVTVESNASEETFKELIVATGHTVA